MQEKHTIYKNAQNRPANIGDIAETKRVGRDRFGRSPDLLKV